MNRRGFILGIAGGLVAAPAIVRASSLMAEPYFETEDVGTVFRLSETSDFLDLYRKEFIATFERNYQLLRPTIINEAILGPNDYIRFEVKNA